MALKIVLQYSVLTPFRAVVVGFSKWATYCGFSVFSKAKERQLYFVHQWLAHGICLLNSSEDKMQVSLLSMQNAIVRHTEIPVSIACGPRPEEGHYERPNSASHINLNNLTFYMRNAAFRRAKPVTSSILCTGFLIPKFRVPPFCAWGAPFNHSRK